MCEVVAMRSFTGHATRRDTLPSHQTADATITNMGVRRDADRKGGDSEK
jgi:hypothetical protein